MAKKGLLFGLHLDIQNSHIERQNSSQKALDKVARKRLQVDDRPISGGADGVMDTDSDCTLRLDLRTFGVSITTFAGVSSIGGSSRAKRCGVDVTTVVGIPVGGITIRVVPGAAIPVLKDATGNLEIQLAIEH